MTVYAGNTAMAAGKAARDKMWGCAGHIYGDPSRIHAVGAIANYRNKYAPAL
ncbi:MAG: hypothetical protein LBS18_07915 [Clostridiales bacterium]|jgi:hypothetical protein|nr:hypothetical protein [Clostridiales bacterium]